MQVEQHSTTGGPARKRTYLAIPVGIPYTGTELLLRRLLERAKTILERMMGDLGSPEIIMMVQPAEDGA